MNRRCRYCDRRAVVADQQAQPVVTIRLDGSIERGHQWVSRFLCADHEHLDPWAES